MIGFKKTYIEEVSTLDSKSEFELLNNFSKQLGYFRVDSFKKSKKTITFKNSIYSPKPTRRIGIFSLVSRGSFQIDNEYDIPRVTYEVTLTRIFVASFLLGLIFFLVSSNIFIGLFFCVFFGSVCLYRIDRINRKIFYSSIYSE